MIKGIGIDICAVDEIASMLENCAEGEPAGDYVNESLAAFFTAGEIERAHRYPAASRAEHLAGIFAAKEAVFKAFDIAWDTGVALNEIEIEAQPSGQPHAVLKGRFAELFKEAGIPTAIDQGLDVRPVRARLHLTISHDAGVAVAAAILEGAK